MVNSEINLNGFEPILKPQNHNNAKNIILDRKAYVPLQCKAGCL